MGVVMKKKLGDITLSEIKEISLKVEFCSKCPLQNICRCSSFICYMDKGVLDTEIELGELK